MKKSWLGWVRAAAGAAAVLAAAEGFAAHKKVLMIGNSFSICVLDQMPQCVKSLEGESLDLCSLYIGGCPLKAHNNNAKKWEQDNSHRPYYVTWNYGGKANGQDAAPAKVVVKNEKGRTQGSIQELLKADKWDVVTVQQASHDSWKPETYSPHGDELIAKIRELAPQAKIMVQETWSYTPFDGRLKTWGITPDEMYAKLKPAYAGFAKKHGLEIIPTGAAVQNFRKAMPSEDGITGDPCGDPKGRDKFHLNREGNYLQACTWTAAIYGADATKITYAPKFMTAERAAAMRKAAQDAVAAR